MEKPELDLKGAGILPHSVWGGRFRAVAGPIMLGTAVWCAAGTLSVAAPETAGGRLALPAAWWVWLVAVSAAACWPAIRQHPLRVTPALLATLPWWPIPMPALGLLWTGPLAWAPIGAAVLAALVPSGLGARRPASPGAWLPFALTLAAGAATAWAVAAHVPGGDEPHYLVITQSLLKDGDLQIRNNHDRGDYREYYGGPLAPHLIATGKSGEAYSIHAPGVSAIVLPAFAIAGYPGARATMLLLAALAGALIWQSVYLATSDRSAAWFAWAAVALSTTFLLQSGMIFPDGPGAAATAAALWLIARLSSGPPVKWPALVAVSAALAALPWLHTRFAVLAGALGAMVVVQLWRLVSTAQRGASRGQVAVFLAIPLVSAVAWFTYFQILYGTFNPMAPYGPEGGDRSWRNIPGGLLASLFDGQYGLLTYAPVLAAFVAGTRRGLRGLPLVAALYVAVVAVYWMWWGGLPATPARFLTAALPLLALSLGVAWSRASTPGRTLLGGWLVVSLAISAVVIGAEGANLAWNYRDAQPRWLEWLAPVVNLPRAWPSFFWVLSVPVAGKADLTSEIPFVIHAVVFAVVLVGASIAALAILKRRNPAPGSRRLTVVWGIAGGLMVAVQAGWMLTGSTGLDPARSQLHVLTRTAAGEPALSIEPWKIAWTRDPAATVRIRSEEAGRYGRAIWGVFSHVPAGRYEVRFFMTRPTASAAVIGMGRGTPPLATVELHALTEQATTVVVPKAGLLVIDSGIDVRDVGGRLEIRVTGG